MKIALTTLLFENPLVTIGIPVGLDPRALRHRLDELEMEATFSGDTADVTYASRLLADSETLIECEFFAPWAGLQDPSGSAARHDAALKALVQVMNRKAAVSGAVGGEAIQLWGELAVDQDLTAMLQDRLQGLDLSVRADEWCRRVVGNSVLPVIVRRMLDVDVGTAPDVAIALEYAHPDLLRQSHEAFVSYLEPQVAWEKLSTLPRHYVIRLIPNVNEIVAGLKSANPDLWRNTMSSLATSVMRTAWQQFHDGDERASEQILNQLLRVELPEADAIKVKGEAANIRYRMAIRVATDLMEQQRWREVIPALQRALAFAPNEQEASSIRETIRRVRHMR